MFLGRWRFWRINRAQLPPSHAGQRRSISSTAPSCCRSWRNRPRWLCSCCGKLVPACEISIVSISTKCLQTERLAVIGRFARSIVHDLKNPLNVIGLTAELVGSEKASAETRRLAQGRIRKQVDRISDMISEILDFTQGTDTQVILAPSDYVMFAEHIVKEIAPEAALKSVTVELESPVDSAKVLLDPKRLRRVFYNLINNATDAMPGGGKVFVRVRSENGQVLTEVEDTGPGIAPEVAEQLFEAFVTFGKAHGTGLGLSITKRILEDHRGWIKARNRNGSGSGAVFTFGLPVVA